MFSKTWWKSLFIDNLGDVLRKAWSVRVLFAAGVLSGLEVVLQIAGQSLLPEGVLAFVYALTVALAFIARILAQKDLKDG